MHSLNCIFSSLMSVLFLFIFDLQFLEIHVKTLPTAIADSCIFSYLFIGYSSILCHQVYVYK